MMPGGGAWSGWPARAALVLGALSLVGPSASRVEGGEHVPESGYFRGAETAPVTIQLFSSLTCPNCAKLHLETLEPLAGSHVAEGRPPRWVSDKEMAP
jgi:protein-disulfide isomerase